jgi:biotin carboxylase
MSNRTLLVLGASLYQIPVIHAARKLGYRIVTSDNKSDNPGHAIADVAYNVSTTDREAVHAVARSESVDGVVAPCTDVAVPTAAYVADKLGLPGPPLRCAEIACDKIAFRQFLAHNGLPVPDFMQVRADWNPDPVMLDGRPWIIKPDRSSGTKGISVVTCKDEACRKLTAALEFSQTGTAVIERFIEGRQGTCEGIMNDGHVAAALITDRQTAPLPTPATCGHRVPTKLPQDRKDEILAAITHVWKLLNYTDGPFDCDFVTTDEQVLLIEMTPRLGGNSLSDLISTAVEFDLPTYCARHACGEAPAVHDFRAPRPTAIVILGVPCNGTLTYDSNELSVLEKEPWVKSIAMDKLPGKFVEAFIDGRRRVGQAIVTGTDLIDLNNRVDELKQRLRHRVIECSNTGALQHLNPSVGP